MNIISIIILLTGLVLPPIATPPRPGQTPQETTTEQERKERQERRIHNFVNKELERIGHEDGLYHRDKDKDFYDNVFYASGYAEGERASIRYRSRL